MRRILGPLMHLILAVTCTPMVLAKGFDYSIQVRSGDLNGDNQTDLFVRPLRGPIPIITDGGVIIIPPAFRSFVLLNDGQGSFTLNSSLTGAQLTSASQWAVTDIGPVVRDVDADGHNDLEIDGIGEVVSGARDFIVYAGRSRGAPPASVFTKSDKFIRYNSDVMNWLADPGYFDRAVKVTASQQPSSRVWYRSLNISSSPPGSAMFLLTQCQLTASNNQFCAISNVGPNPCVITTTLFDANNIPVPNTSEPRNICILYDTHIMKYVLNSVAFEPDPTQYDADARETKEILDRLGAGCPEFTVGTDSSRLNQIVSMIYGRSIGVAPIDRDNTIPHTEYPGDELFTNRSDFTFHHYDNETRICRAGTTNCNKLAVEGFTGLRGFTYPSFRLTRAVTAVDGSEVTAFIPVPPFLYRNRNFFVLPIGTVTQRSVTSGPHIGAIQNVTTPLHAVYPGTISRKVIDKPDGQYIFTHGIGINRFFCSYNTPLSNPAAVQGVRAILAASNDYFGQKTFRQLDRELKAYWEANNP